LGLAPFSTFYVPRKSRPVVVLTLSQRFGDAVAVAGKEIDPARFYNAELAARLRGYKRFWIYSESWDQPRYLSCFLPWLADALQWDLRMARQRKEDSERYFDVWTDVRPEDYVPGLSDPLAGDFGRLHLIRRRQPKGIFALGALANAPMAYGYLTTPLWLTTQSPTPRPTEKPEELLTSDQAVP
jgi:hypothetical protein